MKFKITCRPRIRNSVAQKFISSTLVTGILLNGTSSLASVLSEDGRYEIFDGSDITIDNILEEDTADVEIEGNTMVNVANQKDPIPITKKYTVNDTNHIPLQGEYDGKARPVITGNTLVNLIQFDKVSNIHYSKDSSGYIQEILGDDRQWPTIDEVAPLKPNTTYSLIIENYPSSDMCVFGYNSMSTVIVENPVTVFTTPDTITKGFVFKVHGANSKVRLMLLEGDYSNKEIPRYFEGLKSSFQDQLVTQEMINSGQEKPENLGKYKVEYKSTGKNLLTNSLGWEQGQLYLNGELSTEAAYGTISISTKDYIKLKKDTSYTFSYPNNYQVAYHAWDSAFNYLYDSSWLTEKTFTPSEDCYIKVTTRIIDSNTSTSDKYLTPTKPEDIDGVLKIQLEKGASATEYEPYRESIETFYLNSPLLEGDTIEDINGKATHIRRYKEFVFNGNDGRYYDNNKYTQGKVNTVSRYTQFDIVASNELICDKLKTTYSIGPDEEGICFDGWGVYISIATNKLVSLDTEGFVDYLTKNPIKVVAQLKEPIYETISEDSIIVDSYTNGYLNLNSNIPVNKVDFKPTSTNLSYLYPSTEYTVQFESDNAGKIDKLLLGNEELYFNYSVTRGVNRFNITTPDEITSTELMFDGVGFNLSNLVITEATNESFNYFKGIQSVGQNDNNGHKIEIISNNNLCAGENYNEIFTEGLVQHKKRIPVDGMENTFTFAIYDNNGDLLPGDVNLGINFLDSNNKQIHWNGISPNPRTVTVTDRDMSKVKYIQIFSNDMITNTEVGHIFIGNGNYAPNKFNSYQSNILEIPLSEPLRELPNGVKDRIIKKDGQWVVERNIKEVVLDGSDDEHWWVESIGNWNNLSKYVCSGITDAYNHYNLNNRAICTDQDIAQSSVRIASSVDRLVYISEIMYDGKTLDAFREDLSNNPLIVQYRLKSPIYELLNISSSINLYEDITHISNNSNIPTSMKVTVDRVLNRAKEAIKEAKINPTTQNISIARMWTNLAGETLKKDEFQNELDSITDIVDLEIEKKTVSANIDVYIKSMNSLSMSLNTSSVTFEDYSGVEDKEMQNAVEISVSSSLPYTLNAYLENPLQNSDGTSIIEASSLNIKESNQTSYQAFQNTSDKIVLNENSDANDSWNIHSIDLKLAKDTAHKPDVYRTTIKFEAVQK